MNEVKDCWDCGNNGNIHNIIWDITNNMKFFLGGNCGFIPKKILFFFFCGGNNEKPLDLGPFFFCHHCVRTA